MELCPLLKLLRWGPASQVPISADLASSFAPLLALFSFHKEGSLQIRLVLSLAGSYVYILVKVKLMETNFKKYIAAMYHYTQACLCICLMYFAILGGASLRFSP